jgi:hypothetical protein
MDAHDRAGDRRLAGSGLADKRNARPALNIETHAVKDVGGANPMPKDDIDVPEGEQRFVGFSHG